MLIQAEAKARARVAGEAQILTTHRISSAEETWTEAKKALHDLENQYSIALLSW